MGMNTQYGVYSDDFVTYGNFEKGSGDPLSNDELLIKIVEDD